MTSKKRTYQTDLRRLHELYSPHTNPLMKPTEVPMKRKFVKAGISGVPLVNTETGETAAVSTIWMRETVDNDHFVKLFASGIREAYDLSRTAQRVFQAILAEYERSPMSNGYAETVMLSWFDGGLRGQDIGMSEYTFNRGLRELLDKRFLAPKEPNMYWVNPALFFRGDRVRLVREYTRRHEHRISPDQVERERIEEHVPASIPDQRLIAQEISSG